MNGVILSESGKWRIGVCRIPVNSKLMISLLKHWRIYSLVVETSRRTLETSSLSLKILHLLHLSRGEATVQRLLSGNLSQTRVASPTLLHTRVVAWSELIKEMLLKLNVWCQLYLVCQVLCSGCCCWVAAGIPGTDLLREADPGSRLETGLIGTSW